MNAVTFIIPTMGRKSIDKTIKSLEAQTNQNWKAIVAFDNRHSINYTSNNEKVKVVLADTGGHAGTIRNFAMNLVDTDWIAFVDDDDWLKNTYVEKLQGLTAPRHDFDVIIFTYKDVTNGNTIPPKNTRVFEACKVGISFAVKTDFIRQNNIKFQEFSIEDFKFLDDCRNAGAKYHVTNDIQYFVGGRGKWLKEDG